uniref:Uncharacterized protein n=1 Tax=Anguilla anguilla TaxID=7936 RepID=A0A0E9ULZ6_ANGAN
MAHPVKVLSVRMGPMIWYAIQTIRFLTVAGSLER